MANRIILDHYILTRFNLYLWNKDKEGCPVRTTHWLEHRFDLFEQYCLPSLKSQTCKDFQWIVLFDSTTPQEFKEKIAGYQRACPQLVPVYVRPEGGQYFAQIFRDEVVERVDGERVITTYLDNDDALSVRFVEDLQNRVRSLSDGTFVYYTEGYQFFTDHDYMMKIHYPRNHFVSVVESGEPSRVKTIYGYGSHYYIDKLKGAAIEYVKDLPMWCQVVHEKNMGNDAYFLGAKMVREADDFGFMLKGSSVKELKYGLNVYLFHFVPRYVKTFIRRCKIKLRGYRFE